MKRSIVIAFTFIIGIANAQTYSNNWIDYNKTYYKFNVGSNGLYHISQSMLTSLGLANIPAEQFQLWRNGEQEPIYTSATSGSLPANGFIEFWGKMNDGKIDTKLYYLPDYQLSDHYSLQTDTVAYFLTVNPAGNNLRFTNNPNNVSGTTLNPEPYFMNVRGNYFNTKINPGYAQSAGVFVYSSSYDKGEGFSSRDVYPSSPLPAGFTNANVYSGGPGFSLKYAAAGAANNSRNINVKVFNTVADNQSMPYLNYLKKEVTDLPISLLTDPNTIQISFENTSSVTTDRMVVSFDEITYPSKFIFNNQQDYYFQLPATTAGNYLVIDQFNYGNAAPVLFDLTSYKRYVGDISTPGKVKFVLPPSSATSRQFQLCSEDPSYVQNVSQIKKRNFVNYGLTANQGSYLIISNPLLYTSSAGLNNVDLYQKYRTSAEGGGFQVKIIDVNELVDQFAYGIKKHPSAIKDFIQYAKNIFSSFADAGSLKCLRYQAMLVESWAISFLKASSSFQA